MAASHQDYVVGVVCRGHLSDEPGLIHMTPGKFIAGGCRGHLLDETGLIHMTPSSAM